MDVGDFNGSYFDLSPWRSAVIVPRYSDGSQWAGPSSSQDRVLSHRAVTYHSRQQRLAAIAASAGIDCRVEGRAVRVGGKRRRPEEGGDRLLGCDLVGLSVADPAACSGGLWPGPCLD